MKVLNSETKDIPKIFELYSIATKYMQSKNQVYWPLFSQELIEQEIAEKRQWKLVINEKIACIWATAFNDELIWGDYDQEPSLYLHRITTSPHFRGQKLLRQLIKWAEKYSKSNNLKYLRMDTVGLNQGLINHYVWHGFQFLGTKELENIEGLPAHYKDGVICYFQKEII